MSIEAQIKAMTPGVPLVLECEGEKHPGDRRVLVSLYEEGAARRYDVECCVYRLDDGTVSPSRFASKVRVTPKAAAGVAHNWLVGARPVPQEART